MLARSTHSDADAPCTRTAEQGKICIAPCGLYLSDYCRRGPGLRSPSHHDEELLSLVIE